MDTTKPGAEVIELAEVLNRATQHRPTEVDTFAQHQTALRDLVDANEGERDAWVGSLRVNEARFVLARLDGLAEEHRRRAQTADNTADWIRSALSQTIADSEKRSAMLAASGSM